MMVLNVGDIRAGMEVFGIDGAKLGTVAHAWVGDWHGCEQHDFSRGVLPSDIETVEKGDYFLAVDGALELYVPFDAITILFPGENVTVSLTQAECRERFALKPSFLGSIRTVETQ